MSKIYGAMLRADASSYIPTTGLPGSVLDFYRAHHLLFDEYLGDNPGFIDYRQCNDIAVFESEICSFNDILKFESLLRFVILHDRVDVLNPSVKTVHVNGGQPLNTYVRLPETRKDSATEILHKCGSHDYMFPSEKIAIENGKVVASTLANSIYLHCAADELKTKLANDATQHELLFSIPSSYSVPFVGPAQSSATDFNIIYRDYLTALDHEWPKAMQYNIQYGYNIPLPFFTNAILSMAKNRDDIPNAVLELRATMDKFRSQFFNYTLEFRSIKSPQQMANLQKAMDAAVKLYSKSIFDDASLFSDFVRLIIAVAKQPTELVAKLVNPAYRLQNDYPILFANSNYHRLKGLLKLDNINTNIQNFLTEGEIQGIKKSI
ncbi:MAG: hypothetical protein ACK417_01120 [Bacteroidia bacterium]